MGRLTRNYRALSSEQRIGLIAVCIIAFTTSLCIGGACTAKTDFLTGAGLGGAIGFALAAISVAALLRWGIELPSNTKNEEAI